MVLSRKQREQPITQPANRTVHATFAEIGITRNRGLPKGFQQLRLQAKSENGKLRSVNYKYEEQLELLSRKCMEMYGNRIIDGLLASTKYLHNMSIMSNNNDCETVK
jgi:hypothetical protein